MRRVGGGGVVELKDILSGRTLSVSTLSVS